MKGKKCEKRVQSSKSVVEIMHDLQMTALDEVD